MDSGLGLDVHLAAVMEIVLHPRSPTLAWLRSLGKLVSETFTYTWND